MHKEGMILNLMEWLNKYHLFLLDFDGLLVNSEKLHFEAYRRMCKQFGFSLDWELITYCKIAMQDSTALKLAICDAFPDLKKRRWEDLYEEKKRHYVEVLEEGAVELMPGVENFLAYLEKQKVKRCVVTNSFGSQIDFIRSKLPQLNTIPYWITREHYSKPKPHPECYLKALELYGKCGEKAIGFEDSPRGLRALLGSGADGVLISSIFEKKEIEKMEKNFTHFPSFNALF